MNSVDKVLKQIKDELRGGDKPEEKVFFKSSLHAYDQKAPPSIEGFKLVYDGRTLDAYLDADINTLIIGVRGTKPSDWKDVKADVSLVPNRLRTTVRYSENYKDMPYFI